MRNGQRLNTATTFIQKEKKRKVSSWWRSRTIARFHCRKMVSKITSIALQRLIFLLSIDPCWSQVLSGVPSSIKVGVFRSKFHLSQYSVETRWNLGRSAILAHSFLLKNLQRFFSKMEQIYEESGKKRMECSHGDYAFKEACAKALL